MITNRNKEAQSEQGCVFSFINKTALDFTRYGIYNKINKIKSKPNSIISALQLAHIDKTLIDHVSMTISSRKVLTKDLEGIANKCNIHIKLRYNKLASGKKCTGVRNFGKATSQTTISIGLIHDHYFLIEETQYTSYAIKNYFEIGHVPEYNNIYTKDSNNKYRKSKKKYIDSFVAINILVDHKETHLEPLDIKELSTVNEQEEQKQYQLYQMHLHNTSTSRNSVIQTTSIETSIDDATQLNTNKHSKYKTIKDVKNASHSSAIKVIAKMQPSEERTHLCKWIFDTHYMNELPKAYKLTDKIKILDNNPCYNHTIQHCFNGIDPRNTSKRVPIPSLQENDTIKELHSISPQSTGIFLDYLVRRIICEITQIEFEDDRCNRYATKNESTTTKTSITVFPFQQGQLFQKTCNFNCCQIECYNKVKNTKKYKTQDILQDILIASYCHMESFDQCVQQQTHDKMIKVISKETMNKTIANLFSFCKDLCNNSKFIATNPTLGTTIIGADCDIIIDDILIELKCTNDINEKYCVLQTFAYAALLENAPKKSQKIKHICVINLFQATIEVFNMNQYNKTNMNKYFKILTNQYKPSKQSKPSKLLKTTSRFPEFIDKYEQYLNEKLPKHD